ncbi:MAG: MipA/OmpV family protein [Gammaproteobacteria bacterium]|nr:MipA/OmpV family protein [Gammaproteobacteria bacterium]
MNCLKWVNCFSRASTLLALLYFVPLNPVAASQWINYWELGAGISYFHIPYYSGGVGSKNYLLPFPHILVESDYLSLERNVISGHLFSTDEFKVDISFSGALKADSNDIELRKGMPDLNYVIEAGPSLKWLLQGEFNKDYELTFELPIHRVVTTDLRQVDAIGWRYKPGLYVKKKYPGWTVNADVSLLYATQDYHAYFYSVDNAYVTADRSAYRASSGFSGVEYSLKFKTHSKNMNMGFLMIYTRLDQAVFNDSPLVAETNSLTLGVYASWVFWGSAK